MSDDNEDVDIKTETGIEINDEFFEEEMECETCGLRTLSRIIFTNHECEESQADPDNDDKTENTDGVSQYVEDDLLDVFDIHHVQEYKEGSNNQQHDQQQQQQPLQDVKNPDLLCFYCPLRTTERSFMKSHIREAHPEKRTILSTDGFCWFLCDRCDCKFKWRSHFKRHRRRHVNDRHYNLKCNHCPFRTWKEGYLKIHTSRLHSGAEGQDAFEDVEHFTCDMCDYNTRFKSKLRYHKMQHHQTAVPKASGKKYICPHCGLTTDDISSLKSHIICDHPTIRSAANEWFKCSQCPYHFQLKSELENHMKTHSDAAEDDDVIDLTEGEEVSARPKIYNPTRNNSNVIVLPSGDKLFCCHQCDFKSRYNHSLKEHVLRKHQRPEDVVWFQCHLCPKRFKMRPDLTGHCIRVHGVYKRQHTSFGEAFTAAQASEPEEDDDEDDDSKETSFNTSNPVQCNMCGFIAKGTWGLNVHTVRAHNKPTQRELYCEHCDFRTKYPSWLKQHQASRNCKKTKLAEALHLKEVAPPVVRKPENKKPPIVINIDDNTKLSDLVNSHSRSATPPKLAGEDSGFQCEHCPHLADTKIHLRYHIRRHHTDYGENTKKVILCSLCDFTTTCTGKYKDHILSSHTKPENINWVKCWFCPFKCKLSCNMRKHIKALHPNKYDYYINNVNAERLATKIKTLLSPPANDMDESDDTSQSEPNSQDDEVQVVQCPDFSFESLDQNSLSVNSAGSSNGHRERSRKFRCETCGHEASSKILLTFHVRKFHKDWGEDVDKVLYCSQCDFTTLVRPNLDEHVMTVHTAPENINWLPCAHCPYKSKLKRNLLQHIKTVHGSVIALAMKNRGSRIYGCHQCSFKCKTKFELVRHRRRIHCNIEAPAVGDNGGPPESENRENNRDTALLESRFAPPDAEGFYKCPDCDFRTPHKWYLLNDHHYNVHSSEFKCAKCDFKTPTKKSLKMHIDKNHFNDANNSQILRCAQCEFSTFYPKSMRMHMRYMHQSCTFYKCDQCRFKTHLRNNLVRHVWAKHGGNSASLRTNNVGKSRESAEATEKKYMCNKCDYATDEDYLYKKHLRSHLYVKTRTSTGEMFRCTQCNLTTRYLSVLRKHTITQHTKDEDVKWFKCDYCPYKCKLRRYLTVHIQEVHLKKQRGQPRNVVQNPHQSVSSFQQHKCKMCNFKTNNKYYLKYHFTNRHSKDYRKFECNQCSFVSKYKSSLKDHLIKVHRNSITNVEKFLETKNDPPNFTITEEDFLDESNYVNNDNYVDDNNENYIEDSEEDAAPEPPVEPPEAVLNFNHSIFGSFFMEDQQEEQTEENNVHQMVEDLECKKCHIEFSSGASLESHLKMFHGGNELSLSFKCDKCAFKTPSIDGLRDHKRDKHST